MNYQEIYNALIERAKRRAPLTGYKERHHIIPKSLGGPDSSDNIVELTAREHFIAHLLLAKIHKGPMITALWYLTHRLEHKLTSRSYDMLKEQNSERMSQVMTGKIKSKEHLDNISSALKTSEKAQEQRAALHESLRGKSNSHKGKQQSAEWVAKRVDKLKGQTRSEEAKFKMSAWERTDETKEKMRRARLGKSSGMAGNHKPWSEARWAAHYAKKDNKK